MRGSRSTCPRTWQVEAVADGRLSRADRASFERHAETCPECRNERAGLDRLHQVARRAPAEESPPLRRRFLHNELLRRANERALGKDDVRPVSRRWVVVLATALCAAIAAFVGFSRPTAGPSPAATKVLDEPRFDVVASGGGRWHALQRGPALRLAITAGTYAMSVNKLHAKQSFVVVLPDGELEVRGTRFELVVEAKTLRVAVSEGLVALRLRGRPERALAAGDSWLDVVSRAEAPSLAPSSPPVETAPSTQRHSARAPSVGALRQRSPTAESSSSGESSASVDEPPTAAREFAIAMATFSRGDFATAEQLFLAFEARHPQSAHVEDTLFLRAVARLRRDDEAGARALARQYLRRYPSGFRAVEARRMAE